MDESLEKLLLDIVDALREDPGLDARGLARIVNAHSALLPGARRFAKKQILPFYLRVKAEEPGRWRRWGIDPATEGRLLRLLQMKPRRTASGVATVTVITKPAPCSGNCLFCPADVRMPKSYLHAEPACQRAERNWFDPYLQVRSRLRVLRQMGHATDKVEVIVLGGTFDDYPAPYRIWFAREVFRALNDEPAGETAGKGAAHAESREARAENDAPARPDRAGGATAPDIPNAFPICGYATSSQSNAAGDLETACDGPAVGDPETACDGPAADTPAIRAARYREAGIPCEDAEIAAQAAELQAAVTSGAIPFNRAVESRYGTGAWERMASWQQAGWEGLAAEQRRNEGAAHRCVGLVVETRPDRTTPGSLALLRRLGCTKVQVGVQTLDPRIARLNDRAIMPGDIARTFGLLRLFGFKIHAHFMANLPGATPAGDAADYRRFVTQAPFQPDEVKLYPCALIGSAPLARRLREGDGTLWRPYPEDVLVRLLSADVAATPAFTRISRMIRDFSAGDILAGNKKTNLRQLVEARLREQGTPVREIRFREIGTGAVDGTALSLDEAAYRTPETDERFLQWVDGSGRIAGFLRLSLPRPEALAALGDAAPVGPGEAMIRELHVYGRVAPLQPAGGAAREGSASGEAAAPPGAQHHGLGKALVERACEIARSAGYTRLNVISAVGTREYYRRLGFRDAGLYQRRDLR